MSALAEIDMLRQGVGPARPAKRKARQREYLRVKFFWPTYDPTEAFVPWRAEEVTVEGKSLDGGRVWLQAVGGANLATVYDWMLVNDLTVLSHDLLSSKRIGGRWHGLFAVVIGKKAGGVK